MTQNGKEVYLDYSRLSRHHFGGISYAFHVFHPPFWVTLPSKKVPRCAPYGGRAPCFSHSASAQVLTEIRLWKQEADLSPRSAEGGGSWGGKLHGSSGCSWWIDVTLWQFQHSYGTSPFLVGNIYKWAMHGHAATWQGDISTLRLSIAQSWPISTGSLDKRKGHVTCIANQCEFSIL